MRRLLKIRKSVEYVFQFLSDQIGIVAWLLSSTHRTSGILQHNYRRYENPYVVKLFERYNRTGLQTAEKIVLSALGTKLPSMNMLDIGIGAGRTTGHFAHLTRCYVGIDYSGRMLASAKQRLRGFRRSDFVVCDARELPFEEGFFDFILFSFNGISYMSHEGRLKTLTGIRRIGRRGCRFFFSAHNLRAIESLFSVRRSSSPLRILDQIRRAIILRILYDVSELRKQKYVIICDDPLLGLLTYYVTPEEQISQLVDSGFKDVEVITLKGDRMSDVAGLMSVRDRWLHYSCHT